MTTDATYAVVRLPSEINGRAVEWQPWEPALVLSHVPLDCDTCDWQDGPRTTYGKVTIPPQRRSAEPQKLILYWAFRCPRCQETRVYRRRPGEFSEVLHIPAPGAPASTTTSEE